MHTVLRASTLTLLVASLGLSACGGGNNSGANNMPNAGNIPNLATRPSAQASQLKKIRLTGTIFNHFTQKPIEKAEIQVQILQLAEPTPSANPGASPKSPGTNSGPDAIPTAPPDSPTPGKKSPAPAASSTPFPGPVSPTPASSTPADLPPIDGGLLPGSGASLAQPRFAWLKATGAAFQLAQNTSAEADKPEDKSSQEPNLYKTTTNNKGKFSLNDIPDGNLVLTVTAPGYVSLTLTDVNPASIEVPLMPLAGQPKVNVVGVVLSPLEKGVLNAEVSASFPLGEGISVPDTSDDNGQFMLPQVPQGIHSLVALLFDENQQIKQMGILRNLPLFEKNLKVKKTALDSDGNAGGKPSAKPGADEGKRQELIDNVEKILTDATPSPTASESAAPAASPDASVSPAASPEPAVSASPASEENEEKTDKEAPKTFNIFDAATEFFTGDKPDGAGNEEIYPAIPLRSVLNDTFLAGTIDLPEGYEVKNLDVYLMLPADKGDMPQEAYLMTQPLRGAKVADASSSDAAKSETDPAAKASAKPAKGKDASKVDKSKESKDPKDPKKESIRFRTTLPHLEKNYSYHLQFTAVNKGGGELSFHHLYHLDQSDEDLDVSFLPAVSAIEIEGEEVNAVPPVPEFSWEAVNGADIYHLTLEVGSGENRKSIWEAWTKGTSLTFPLDSRLQRLKEKEVYTVTVAALKGLNPAFSEGKKQYSLPSYHAIWTDLAQITHQPFEVVE